MHKCDFKQAGRGQAKGDACDHVDIGIQHRGHHKNGTPERTNFRKPVFGRLCPAEHHAQLALHRAGIFKKIGIGKSNDIGRNCRRQKQHPFKNQTAGKFITGDNPGSCHPEETGKDADAQHQPQRIADIAEQNSVQQMPPQPVTAACRCQDKRQHRAHKQEAQHKRADGPAI